MFTSIRNYRVVRPLGAGGMGEVYLAEDTRLDRPVALKLLPVEVASDPRHRQRFQTEAKAIAALNHPNICTIHEIGQTDDGRPFIAMELLEGETIDAWIKRGRIPLKEIVETAVQVADALAAAHNKGILHRDLKPSNLFRLPDGRVKVLDFGLAKRVIADPQPGEATTQFQTQSGAVMGTPNYMSPEQALGNEVDARTDIFSLGVVLYQMVTGRLPFSGRSPQDSAPPEAMARFNYEVPQELERIILKCLRKAPDDRYQFARELIVDLRALKESATTTGPEAVAAPVGQVITLLFVSTNSEELEKTLGAGEAARLLRTHQEQLKQGVKSSGRGMLVESAGSTSLLSFSRPSAAVQLALQLHRSTAAPLTCRMAIHLAEVLNAAPGNPREQFGEQFIICERLLQLAHPGQILMSRAVFDNARQVLRATDLDQPGELSWLNHGPYLLKGIDDSLEICQVGIAGVAPLSPPPNSDKAKRYLSDESEPVLGWRPALDLRVPGTEWILEKKLGEGGFGEVWLGRHEKLKHRRVFKFCFRADRVRSLKREVTLFRVLKEKVGHHPNIIGVQEVYFNEPPFYIVMDYAEATDLKAWCEQTGWENIPAAARLEIVAQVCDGLHAAHQAGVLHRDVKPSNILVASEKPSPVSSQPLQAKLTDFGIGQVLSQEAFAGMTRLGFTMTMLSPGSSSQTGTHLYMAPELLAGKPASPQSDIYSLGVVLYQLLIADFSRPVTTDWSKRIRDPLLREDLEKCFAGDPEDRFSSAGELGVKLREIEKRRSELAERQAANAARQLRARRRHMLLQSAMAALFLSLLVLFFVFASKRAGPASPTTKSIVVLPFKNEPRDEANEYLSASLNSEFISRLRKVSSLRPVPTPPSMADDRIEDVRVAVSAQFNDPGLAIFEATLHKSGGQLLMDARLVAGEHSWTNRSSLEPKNLLIVPGDLVRLVTAALKIPLTPSERQRVDATPTRDPEAYDAYLNGKFNGIQVDESHNRAAIAMFERAVARDPNFAIAHAELGRVYANRLSILRPNEKELEAKAKRAIDRALFLDPKLPEAHTALGQLLWSPFHQFDHEGALVEFLKALDADPESDDAQLWLNLTLGHIGLLEEEVQLATRMTLVNPLSPRGYWLKGLAQTDQRKYAAALQSMSRAQSEHWIPALGEWKKAVCHFELGHTNEAREIIEASKAKFPDDYGGIFGSLQAMIYAKAGATAQAEAEIAKAIKHKERFIHFHHTAYQIASAYALMNNTKEGVRWFRELVNDGFNSYPLFRDDPNINSLRDDKEFNDLLDAEKEKYNRFKTKFGIGSPAWEHLQRKSK